MTNYNPFYDDNLWFCSGGVAGKGTGGERLASVGKQLASGG
jgi:hypothetical protein